MIASVEWHKTAGTKWHRLFDLDLGNGQVSDRPGVYLIWHGSAPWVNILKVGHGALRPALASCLHDAKLLDGRPANQVYVTWAETPPDNCAGAAKYLAETLGLALDTEPLDARPVQVNLPC
ncbi:MAG: hypothetical protein WC980_01980 [Candidatus Brocadiia bacterium]